MTPPIILLTNDANADRLTATIRSTDGNCDLTVLTGRDGVVEALETAITDDTLLFSFSTGVVVPARLLAALAGPAYNFHAASPEYPGRDPHHFAVYFGAEKYGATAHEMAAKVDSGRIVGVEWFDVAPGTAPQALREQATEAAFRLFRSLAQPMMRRERLPEVAERWAERTFTRKDFLEMCRITPEMDKREFERRYFAFDGGPYDNLTLEIYGQLFRIDKSGRR